MFLLKSQRPGGLFHFSYLLAHIFLQLAHLVSSSYCLNCFIGPSPDKYAIRFIPRENGVHTIDVKFNGTHIPGSPFQVRVGEPGQGGDAGLVTAYGAGLERGTTGSNS